MVPLVLEALSEVYLPPRSVVDVGCGEGWWGATFAAHGVPEVIGIDSHVERCEIADYRCQDIRYGPFPRADLAVCLEVAEHLEETHARTLVARLVESAPVVLWSAAIPGQGGNHHVNEQPMAYWLDLFGERGYASSGALRWAIWDDDRVENWYKANTLVFAREPERFPSLFDTPLAPPWQVVHPILFDARRRP